MCSETRPAHSVEEVIAQVQHELQLLLEQRIKIVQRISSLKQTLAGLANLYGEAILSENLLELIDRKPGARNPGFTRTCRTVLMESSLPLTAHEVWHEIQRRQPHLVAHHKSPIASITTVMSRLVKYGEAQTFTTPAGRKAFRWAAPVLPDSLQPILAAQPTQHAIDHHSHP